MFFERDGGEKKGDEVRQREKRRIDGKREFSKISERPGRKDSGELRETASSNTYHRPTTWLAWRKREMTDGTTKIREERGMNFL